MSEDHARHHADHANRKAADEPTTTGTVKWFNDAKGYGFISSDQGGDLFVHFKSIKGNGFRSLKEGQKVKFVAKQGPKGLQAEDVEPA
jgi:CspA family cold shock protein